MTGRSSVENDPENNPSGPQARPVDHLNENRAGIIRRGGFLLERFFARARDSYLTYHAHAQFKLEMTLLIGLAGFPFFYVLWKWILPQPYNSAVLSAIGFAMIAGIGVVKHGLPRYRRFLPLYSYIAKLYCLPFFFSYMLLMNGVNMVWQLSAMAAFVYVCLLYDTVNAVIVSLLGAAAAYLAYGLATGWAPLPAETLTFVPIMVFMMVGLIVLNYSDRQVLQEKMDAASTLAGHIAHEMRTPLLGINFDAERAADHLPVAIEGYRWAVEQGWEGGRIRKRQLQGLTSSMERIQDHTSSANLVIDMLLVNAGQETIAPGTFNLHSVANVIDTTLSRYHFRAGERDRVHVLIEEDFNFYGSDLLLTHTIFNLLKNALRALEAAGGGRLEIEARRGVRKNLLIVRDDGPGIAPEIANQIFIPFITGEKAGLGTGIGLAFSKYVVESFGGTITCRSAVGEGAEFVITLPAVPTRRDIAMLRNRLDHDP